MLSVAVVLSLIGVYLRAFSIHVWGSHTLKTQRRLCTLLKMASQRLKWGTHRSGDLGSFLTKSAVSHLGELQPVYWSESEFRCTNQASEEAIFISALLKPGSKSVYLSGFIFFFFPLKFNLIVVVFRLIKWSRECG